VRKTAVWSLIVVASLVAWRQVTHQVLPVAARSLATAPAEPVSHANPEDVSLGVMPASPKRISLSAISAETDPDRRAEALDRAVESIADADVPEVLDGLMGGKDPAANELRPLLVRRWAERDPQAAAAWAGQFPEGGERRMILEQIALAWAEKDFSTATGWVNGLPAGESREGAALAIGYEAAATQPKAALALADLVSTSPAHDDLIVHAVSQWGGADPAAALEWVNGVPDEQLRQRLLAAVAVASAKRDGRAAAALAAEALAPGPVQDRTAVAVVQRWAQQSPIDAASWVAQFPETSTRNVALENLFAIWLPQDSASAIRWISELPAGSFRDSASSFVPRAAAQ
jgi:hypothetical protein